MSKLQFFYNSCDEALLLAVTVALGDNMAHRPIKASAFIWNICFKQIKPKAAAQFESPAEI